MKSSVAVASVPATCFPTASALASSWDVALVRRVGEAIGREARDQGVSVVLGPGSIAQAHAADEWVEIDQLEIAAHRLVDGARYLAALRDAHGDERDRRSERPVAARPELLLDGVEVPAGRYNFIRLKVLTSRTGLESHIDLEDGTPPGEKERVIGAMTTRVGSSRLPRRNGANRA